MRITELIKAFLQDNVDKPYPIWESAFSSSETVLFKEEVRAACEKNYCGCYSTCWNCPPGVGAWETLRDLFYGYENAFVFTTRHELEDPFDIEGMDEGRLRHESLARALQGYLKKEGLAPKKDFEILGAGGCHICEKCSYPDAPCRHPDMVFRSMEACGIDVVALSSAVGMHYINGENTVTYFSVVFYS